MSSQEGSKDKEGFGLEFGAFMSKLYETLEQLVSKMVSGQQNLQAVGVSSLLIAKAFTAYGMLKLTSILTPGPGCKKVFLDALDAFENNLRSISNYLEQDKLDIVKAGELLDFLNTNETIFVNNLLICSGGKQA
jgi:hypothetical protein